MSSSNQSFQEAMKGLSDLTKNFDQATLAKAAKIASDITAAKNSNNNNNKDANSPPPPNVPLDMAKLAQEANERGAPAVYEATLPPPFVSQRGFGILHQQTLQQNSHGHKPQSASMNTTLRPHVQHGPAPLISSLKQTTLREVAKKVNCIHEDKVLFLQTIWDAHRIVGTNLLVQDDAGDCVLLSVYNLVPPQEDPNDFIPKGTYFCLLCPYMKNSCDDPTKTLLLRTDNPECLRLFHTRREWLAAKKGKKLVDTKGLDPDTLKQQGNQAFGQERYETAARCYSRALDCKMEDQQLKLACLGNLAEVRLRQELWEAAERNAKAALEIDPTHSKSRFRLATALIRLHKIEEATKLMKEGQQDKSKAIVQLKNQLKELSQESKGIYNLKKIHDEASNRPGQALTSLHANYTSPSINKGVSIPKHDNSFTYRGTLATKDIPANTLISCSKALVFCSQDPNLPMDVDIDPYKKSMLKGAYMALENQLILLLHQRPELREKVSSLDSGYEDPNISTNNNTNAQKKKTIKIDIDKIRGIVQSNTFGISDTDDVEQTWEKVKQQQKSGKPNHKSNDNKAFACKGSGFWWSESFFNHSCTPNCTWKQMGDLMLVWTTRPVKANEELSISYCSNDLSYADRSSKFANWIENGLGFECACDWCHSIRNNPEHKALEERAHNAFHVAACLVVSSQGGIEMAAAAERALPSAERKSMMEQFAQLPSLGMQHNACANLWVMEGDVRAHQGNPQGALEAYQKAADIKYAVRGACPSSMGRAKDLWRLVGASMACDQKTQALEHLKGVYKEIFRECYVPHKQAVFKGLTLHYAMPWWHDNPTKKQVAAMEELVSKVLKDTNKLNGWLN